MSYTPTLVIKKADLDKIYPIIENDQWSNDEDTKRFANYLLGINQYQSIEFDNLELIVCTPEHSSLNLSVRKKLTELNVDYRVSF